MPARRQAGLVGLIFLRNLFNSASPVDAEGDTWMLVGIKGNKIRYFRDTPTLFIIRLIGI